MTERESWILGNKDSNPNVTVAENADLIEPGMEFAPPTFRVAVEKEVKAVLDAIYSTHGNGAWKKKVMINDRIADSIFQQVVTRADEYAVLACPNLNGDYISDACAAQVGGLGIAPGANIGDGYAIFEATHGTAPKYADKNVINPGSVILLRGHDVPPPRLERSRGLDRAKYGADDRTEKSYVQFRAPDARRHQSKDQRIRRIDDRKHGRRRAGVVQTNFATDHTDQHGFETRFRFYPSESAKIRGKRGKNA